MPKINTVAIRLKPGDDLKMIIMAFAESNGIMAGWLVSCVGSLTSCTIRFANQSEGFKKEGHYEILSVNGTISKAGCHLHICISDSEGKTIGGHLLEGNIISTTAEIIIQYTDEFRFGREIDDETGWKELVISKP